LELFVLTGFAVGQPLLDVLGRSPDFLVFRQADARDIVLLAVTIVVLPAVVLGGLEVVAGLAGRRVQQAVHLLVAGGLVGLLGLEAIKTLTGLRNLVLVVVSALVGIGAGLGYAKLSAFRLWVRFASPAPIVFVLVFLLVSPASELLRPVPAVADTGQPAATFQRDNNASIVFVLFDELPLRSLLDHGGQIDRRLYPNFARLAAGSTWYRNASTVAGMTRWAVPAMFTGRYPARDLAPMATRYPDNLFTLLGSAGYDMRVFEGVTQLCPRTACTIPTIPGGHGGFRRIARDSAQLWARLTSPGDVTTSAAASLEEDTVDPNKRAAAAAPKAKADPTWAPRPASLDGFISALRPTGRPSVHFLHILLPHQPWKYLPSGLKYPERLPGKNPASHGGGWTSERWPVQSIHQRHLMQTAYTDHLLGTIIKRMRQTGLYDHSLLVVTADHGMAFTPGASARASVTPTTVPDVLWVPLFIKRPGQHSAVVSEVNIEHVDILPTVAGLSGLDVPWPIDGVSWADPGKVMRRGTDKIFYPRPAMREVIRGPANHAIALQGLADQVLHVGDDYLDWFRFGPNADLVGKRVGDLAVAGPGGTAQVLGLDDYHHVDPASGLVPAEVTGRLISTLAGITARPAIAVAVNGVIGGVSETFAEPFAKGGDPPRWFTTMVPDSLLGAGDNKLQLFVVDPAGGTRQLRPLSLTG
jgi:hypothetical protein